MAAAGLISAQQSAQQSDLIKANPQQLSKSSSFDSTALTVENQVIATEPFLNISEIDSELTEVVVVGW